MYKRYDNETGSWNDDILMKKMDEMSNEAYEALEKVVHPKFVKEFAEVLAVSFFEEESPAISLAESLHLRQIHFYAIMEDTEGFLHELIKEKESEYEPNED